MKKFNVYLLFVLLSFVWLDGIKDRSQVDTFYNRTGTSTINVVQSDINNTVLEVVLEGYELKEIIKDEFLIEIDKGIPSLIKGSPNLPKLNTSIIIPDQANMKISIIDVEYEEFNNINIVPSKGNIIRNIDPSTVPYVYGNVYKNDSFYPTKLAELGNPYILRGVRGQGIIINPIQYNPISKTVRIYSKILIDISKSNKLNKKPKNIITRREDGVKTTHEFENIYKNLFINYQNDVRFDYLSDQGNMLVICYDDFMDEMEPFVLWKNKKGIPTEIIPLSSIGSSAAQIQEYINTYYYENGLTYLLLVGDIAQMPTHIVGGSASDPTYGFIEGDDAFSEIIVGRFSANNPSHVAIQVQKTLEYEQDPSTEVEHLNNALGIASTQGPGYGGLTDAEFNELLWGDFLDNFTYDSYQGVYDGSGSLSEGINAINEGVGIINYTGHSGPTGWGNGAPLSVTDVNNLINTDKLPFIFTVGCNPGEFNNYTECFCESWMWATDDSGNPTGAVGHLGSTISQSWEPPMHGQWAMNAILTESYEDNTSRSYGGVAVNGCMHMNEAQGSYGINETLYWTLFGDPSLLIRTDIPEQLIVNHDQSIIVGQTELVVDVGISGALVALSVDGALKSHAYSNGGVAILDLSGINTNPGEIDLVVSSFNTYPYQSTIQVVATDGAYLVFDSYELESDSNWNNFIEYGDDVELNILVENVGNMNASAIDVSVTSEDEYITMIDGDSMIAYAIMNEVHGTEDPISFSIAQNVPDGHNAQFDLILDSGEDQWQATFSVEIHAPVFEIFNTILIDDNNDGVWDPGEGATLTVELANTGSASFSMYPGAVITCDSPYINILSGENDNTFFGIGSNMSYDGTFVIESDISTPENTEVELTISWGYSPTAPCNDDCVEQAELLYSTIIGHPSILIWDPSTQHISGNRLVNYFNENNITGFDYIDNQDLDSIENYKTAFILLGIYPENHVLQETQSSAFIELLNNSGNVYMEGGDTWAFDISTVLHSMFGLIAEADGSADLSTISGVGDTFTEGMSFSYDGGNSYVDRILPSGGFPILNNDSPEYTTAVAFDNTELGYRTIGASHDIGGLQGDDFEDYVDSILEFFNDGSGSIDPECVAGDINGDGTIDVTDIIRQVNIILNTGEPASDDELCAADANGDGSINISDVVIIINIILDRNNYSPSRMSIIDDVNVIEEHNSLYMKNEGPIRGIEIVIYSDSDELNLNETLNMDIAYNTYDGKHHLLIYSLNGNVLHEGKYELFSSNEMFEIDNLIVLNSNNDSVQINYINNTQPEMFVLKQNYPNPFNPTTNIDIELLDADNIKLIVYDINGRQVKQLANGYYSSGSYDFSWNSIDDAGRKVSSGIYIYQLITSHDILTKKMLLLK